MPPPHVPAAAQPPQPRMDTANGKFELMKDIGSGNFGVAKLMRDRQTGEMLAVKCECFIKGLHACRGRSAPWYSSKLRWHVKSPLHRRMSAESSCAGSMLLQILHALF